MTDDPVRFHLRVGWWAIFAFVAMGLALEAMHGLKLGLYLDLANATRRHLWTLAHAHGTLLGVLNVAFAFSLRATGSVEADWVPGASRLLLIATLLLPGGFLLGGVIVYGGDPGVGVVLSPIGGLALVAAGWITARRI